MLHSFLLLVWALLPRLFEVDILLLEKDLRSFVQLVFSLLNLVSQVLKVRSVTMEIMGDVNEVFKFGIEPRLQIINLELYLQNLGVF